MSLWNVREQSTARTLRVTAVLAVTLLCLAALRLWAAESAEPSDGERVAFADAAKHDQKDPISALEAPGKMTLPPGFKVKLFAGEPDVIQPFAFCIDDRARLWVCENLNYQTRGSHKQEPLGRIAIYEDEDGDGQFDTRKLFIDKLFFPSGLEKGYGGVFVGSPPNLYFIPDRNHDDVPDGPPEAVLDGWGINDRHETLNSFIWGPDGWLYGCHGVFTQANIGKPGAKDDERIAFNAGWWRYHPVQKKFELFAEGGSNQWGVDFDDRGQAFATACVIPHLWHVIQGGRYHRQAGTHTLPYTYDDIKTIADHKHLSAHGGARVYLADQFPPEYRQRLFMGNLHEHALLTDVLEPKGSGFVGHHGDKFLDSNDKWFLGFNIELGPEGAIWIIDWYDSDTCGRKIDAIDTGRIYRVTYGDVKRDKNIDLARLSDAELVKLQLHVNDWYVRHARRLLAERAAEGKLDKSTHAALWKLLADQPETGRKLRALWCLHVTGGLADKVGAEKAAGLLTHEDEYLRAWTIQCLCEGGSPGEAVLARMAEMAKNDPSQVVRKYLASALMRLPLDERWSIAEGLVSHEEDAADHNLPLLYWYGIEPLVQADKLRAVKLSAVSRVPTVRQFVARRLAESGKAANDARPGGAFPADALDALKKLAPGFDTKAIGEGGLAQVKDHFGRAAVRTHPVDRNTACVLKRQIEVPVNKITHLALSVAHDPRGDWQLLVKADGQTLKDVIVGSTSVKEGWLDMQIDLTPFKGKTITLELANKANDWSWEFAYWGRAVLLTD